MHKALKTMLKVDIITPYTTQHTEDKFFMNEYDISKEAKNTLREIRLVEIRAKVDKSKLTDAMDVFLEDIDFGKDTKEYLETIYELVDRDYIHINLDMNPYKGEIYSVKSIRIKRKGKKYIRLYMVYNGGLDLDYREEPNNVDYMLRKLKENGIYIVGGAAAYLLCEIINAIANLISALK